MTFILDISEDAHAKDISCAKVVCSQADLVNSEQHKQRCSQTLQTQDYNQAKRNQGRPGLQMTLPDSTRNNYRQEAWQT